MATTRYIVDHDVHIHTKVSPCSADPRQIPEAILAYGLTNGFRLLSLADHGWDTDVPCPCPCWGPIDESKKWIPLPQSKKCHFMFGMEADMNQFDTLGLTKAHLEEMDFSVISVDHLNLRGFTINPEITGDDAPSRKKRYLERLHTMLDMDLPFYKTTVGHFSDALVCDKDPFTCISLLTDEELKDVFGKVKRNGMGVELNFRFRRFQPEQLAIITRPFFIAKALGCKFTLGGDAHHPESFTKARENMETIVNYLELTEDDKLPYIRETIERLDKEGEECFGSRKPVPPAEEK